MEWLVSDDYPREPRPSYADQILSLLNDHGVVPSTVQEVRELQTALGLVAAEDGVCILPAAVHMMGRLDIHFRELVQRAVSPIIISHRKDDMPPHLATMIGVIAALNEAWGWPMPTGLMRRLGGEGAKYDEPGRASQDCKLATLPRSLL